MYSLNTYINYTLFMSKTWFFRSASLFTTHVFVFTECFLLNYSKQGAIDDFEESVLNNGGDPDKLSENVVPTATSPS